MPIVKYTLILFIIIITIIIVFFIKRIERKRREKYFSHREKTNIEDIYIKYFIYLKIDKDQFTQIWDIISSILHIDPYLLRPYDKLTDINCGILYSLSGDMNDLYEFIEDNIHLSSPYNEHSLDNIYDVIKLYSYSL